MGDVFADGNTRVAWVPTIANQNAPTTTELNAGILLQKLITPDGLMGFDAETQEVDSSSLASTFNTKNLGRDNFDKTGLRLKKQSASDTAYTTMTRGATGFIVIRRDIAETTAWTSGQPCEVYPVICGRRKRLSPEANTLSRYEVPTMITDAPSQDAAVA